VRDAIVARSNGVEGVIQRRLKDATLRPIHLNGGRAREHRPVQAAGMYPIAKNVTRPVLRQWMRSCPLRSIDEERREPRNTRKKWKQDFAFVAGFEVSTSCLWKGKGNHGYDGSNGSRLVAALLSNGFARRWCNDSMRANAVEPDWGELWQRRWFLSESLEIDRRAKGEMPKTMAVGRSRPSPQQCRSGLTALINGRKLLTRVAQTARDHIRLITDSQFAGGPTQRVSRDHQRGRA
jgi:hypothetical protein